jgi:trk system potassium uptake protein TrkA
VSFSLKSLNFLGPIQRENRQFAVIGLGRFGRSACKTLHDMGYEVLGTDINQDIVDQVLAEQITPNAIQLDSTKVTALKQAGIFEFDTVIVAIGNYVEESIITTLNVKEAGVRYVVAKASSDIHGKLLQKVGADHVVFPERDAGCQLAFSLTKQGILERLVLDDDNSIVEIVVPEEFDGKTLAELQLRNRYGLNVLAVSSGEKFIINPSPSLQLHKGLALVVIGANQDIKRLPI